MIHRTLIRPAELQTLLRDAADSTVVFDCSFDLSDAEAGTYAYAGGHLPGAQYLHLDDDLSGAKTGRNGRHPLPPRQAFCDRMAGKGVGDDTQVVAYDSSGGVYASRLWWLLRWIGHERVAVLDGGLPAWRAHGGKLETDPPPPRPRGRLTLRPSLVATVERDEVLANLATGKRLVVDARNADRFRGENETLDPVAGHIPGARNRPFRDNLDRQGRFKPAAELAAEWAPLVAGRHAADVVMQCGSGVTACHSLLALEVAGLGTASLYPGSWSEWIADPRAPVATGPA